MGSCPNIKLAAPRPPCPARHLPNPLQRVTCLVIGSRRSPFLGLPYCRCGKDPSPSQVLAADLSEVGATGVVFHLPPGAPCFLPQGCCDRPGYHSSLAFLVLSPRTAGSLPPQHSVETSTVAPGAFPCSEPVGQLGGTEGRPCWSHSTPLTRPRPCLLAWFAPCVHRALSCPAPSPPPAQVHRLRPLTSCPGRVTAPASISPAMWGPGEDPAPTH